MTKGKRTCKILKEIRKQIAAENDIELVISECTYQGDCLGTCPKCEAEVRYLERELEKRQRLGKAVAIAGLSVGMLGALDSCGINKKTDSSPVDEWHLMGLPAVEVQVEDELLPKEIKEVSNSELQDTTCFELNINSTNVDEMLDNAVSKYIEETILGYSVDQLPQFPGGDTELLNYVNEYVRNNYPWPAGPYGVEGNVFVSFTVEADGSLSNIKVLKGLGFGCDEVALELVKAMPKWKPAMNRGEAVIYPQYALPVRFELSKEEGELVTYVERPPVFPDGEEKLKEYLKENVVYPQEAREAGIKGKVFVAFVVETDGKLSNVYVLRGIGGGCDEEAVRVVQSMPNWEPATQRGKAVRMIYMLPIAFSDVKTDK